VRENTIGYVAAALTTLSFIPQALQMFRTRDVSGISLPTYIMFCVGLALWVAYGFALRSLPIILANVVTLSLAASILWMRIRYRRPG
jgi:MtN3 and saliva related transmembrane protein